MGKFILKMVVIIIIASICIKAYEINQTIKLWRAYPNCYNNHNARGFMGFERYNATDYYQVKVCVARTQELMQAYTNLIK